MANPLLDSELPLTAWLSNLARVSARLYETHVDVWERFEPERKRLQETLSFLDCEGKLDIRVTTASEGIKVLCGWSVGHSDEWRELAAEVQPLIDLASIFKSAAGAETS